MLLCFIKVGDEERRMRWTEWVRSPPWTGPRPSRTARTNEDNGAAIFERTTDQCWTSFTVIAESLEAA